MPAFDPAASTDSVWRQFAAQNAGVPAGRAVARPDMQPGENPMAWYQRRVDADPNYAQNLPGDLYVDDKGQVKAPIDWGHVTADIGKWGVYGTIAAGSGMALAPYLAGAGLSGAGAAAAQGAVSGGVNGALRGADNGGLKGALVGGAIGAGTGAATGGLSGGTTTPVVNTANGASKMDWSGALQAIGGKTATGGTNWAGLAQTGLGVAGALAQGRQATQAANTQSTITRDSQGINAQAQNDNARAQAAQVEMQQKEAQRTALNDAYKNALQSSLALNMKDASFNRPAGVPTITMGGGARPSALGAQGKQAAELMNAKALSELMDPEKLTALPMPAPYSLTDLPKSGALDNILGAAGAVGNVVTANQARQDATKQSSLIADLLAASRQQVAAPAQQQQPGLVMPSGGSGLGPMNWSDGVRF